jgi:hypothetical protein
VAEQLAHRFEVRRPEQRRIAADVTIARDWTLGLDASIQTRARGVSVYRTRGARPGRNSILGERREEFVGPRIDLEAPKLADDG